MITTVSNPQMKKVRELLAKAKERRKEKCFIAEGIRMVSETPQNRLMKVYVSESFYRNPPDLRGFDISQAIVVDDQVFRQVSDTQTPQGIMAIVRQEETRLDDILSRQDPLLIFIENVQDPGNLGTIMRTAEGAGVTGIIMSRDTVDIYNPKVVRATMGSLYRMPFTYVDDLGEAVTEARRRGVQVYAAHLSGSHFYDEKDYRKATGFMIGNEGNGLTDHTASLATDYILIPMEGKLESLNASVAAAVLMYEASRQRRHGIPVHEADI